MKTRMIGGVGAGVFRLIGGRSGDPGGEKAGMLSRLAGKSVHRRRVLHLRPNRDEGSDGLESRSEGFGGGSQDGSTSIYGRRGVALEGKVIVSLVGSAEEDRKALEE
ncbi:hypothetical protein MTO96_026901 [Rhipicephalus appendiculatus]